MYLDRCSLQVQANSKKEFVHPMPHIPQRACIILCSHCICMLQYVSCILRLSGCKSYNTWWGCWLDVRIPTSSGDLSWEVGSPNFTWESHLFFFFTGARGPRCGSPKAQLGIPNGNPKSCLGIPTSFGNPMWDSQWGLPLGLGPP